MMEVCNTGVNIDSKTNKHNFRHFCKTNTDNCNVNSASYVTMQSNNSTNTNGSVAYLNLNNSPSNTNANISSRLLPIGSFAKAFARASKQYPTSPLGEK